MDIFDYDNVLLLPRKCRVESRSECDTSTEFGGRRFEVDEFHGANEGLVIAEVELAREDESFALPLWLGAEVSRDPRYRVSSLARNPFGKWHRC